MQERLLTSLMRIAAAVAVCALLGRCADERVEVQYQNVEQARGAIRLGHVPSCLPPSAREIMTLTDLDRNSSYGRFAFEPVDGKQSLARLASAELTEIAQERVVMPKGRNWWSADLVGDLESGKLSKSNLKFFKCPIEAKHTVFRDFIIAVDEHRSLGYFWTT